MDSTLGGRPATRGLEAVPKVREDSGGFDMLAA